MDWLRNLQAAGTGGMKVEGVQYAVREPRVLGTTEVLGELPRPGRRFAVLYGFEHFLRVVATPVAPTPAERTDARAARVGEPAAEYIDKNT